MNYDHKVIEKKWQIYWETKNTFKVNLNSDKPKYYALDMFPYPSGEGLHVGHPEGYTATDIISRLKRMQGFEVLHPIGFDSFGLPAEQYAIKTNNSPKLFTLKNIENFKEQLKSLGFSFSWEKTLITSEPYYYKHTQWIFAQLYKHNLTELKNIEVNWCEELNTVLSNEEVILDKNDNPVSERGEFPVVKKAMKQWVLKITKYADRLFSGLEDLDWPKNIKTLQYNWIYNEGNSKKGLHLRDWVFARQRYWGEPFPIIHLENGEIYLIPEINYPVLLPEISNYKFSKDGKPPLVNATNWINYNQDGIKGVRDLNTMPQWAASSWYHIAYILREDDSENNPYILDLASEEAKKRLSKWLPVDLYIGGQEHAVLHLLYARFWNLFLYDIGILSKPEPFFKLYNQGMILGEDNEKMSKSKGNTVSPNDIIEQFGADSLRVYEMFMGPLSDDKPWSTQGIKGIRVWLDRVFNIINKIEIDLENKDLTEITEIAYNQFIINFTKNTLNLKFNNAVSDMMIFVNHIYKVGKINLKYLFAFIQALSLFAPHLAEEMWSIFKNPEELSFASWNEPTSLKPIIEINISIQINGKYKGIILETKELSKLQSFNNSLEQISTEVLAIFEDIFSIHKIELNEIKKIIYIQKKAINIII